MIAPGARLAAPASDLQTTQPYRIGRASPTGEMAQPRAQEILAHVLVDDRASILDQSRAGFRRIMR
jgi:hypothetical protein